MPIVEAVGVATHGKKASDIQDAMADAVIAIQAECERIWNSDLPLEERQAKIDRIRSPEAIRAAMLAARTEVKAQDTDERAISTSA